MKLYNIAGHFVAIDFKDERFDETLLPNFSPFVSDDDSFPLLTISVYAHCEWKDEISEVGTFDVGGCMYGVWRTIEGGYRYEINDIDGHLCARMQSDALFNHCEVELLEGTPAQMHYGLNNCVMMSYAFATATQDTILIHSSVIRCDGKGYLMTAPSGTGKSTHTRLWRELLGDKVVMINDDKPIIRYIDGDFYVYGTPWMGKHNLGANVRAKLKAICKIRQEKENVIESVSPAEMLVMILNQTLRPEKLENMDKLLGLIEKMLAKTKLFSLGCNISLEAAQLSYNAMVKGE